MKTKLFFIDLMEAFNSSNGQTPRKGVRLVGLLLSVILLWSCGHEKKRDVYFSSFEKEIVPERLPVGFSDTIPLIVGSVAPVEDGYWCYLYENENCLLATDKDFVPKAYFARRGAGPGEVSNISGAYGDNLWDNGMYSVFEPSSGNVYGTNAANNYNLKKVVSLEPLRKYAVWKVVKLKDGRYVAVKGDNTCGVVEYDPSDGSIKEWPLGFDLEKAGVTEGKMSMFSVIQYNPERGIIAVIYGNNPTMILYDENGDIVRTLTYSDYKPVEDASSNIARCYSSMRLTDDHIWLLLAGEMGKGNNTLMVLDYDGNPVARIPVGNAMKFCVDSATGRLIAIDYTASESGLVVYDLPDLD